jgi:hypothetical protein
VDCWHKGFSFFGRNFWGKTRRWNRSVQSLLPIVLISLAIYRLFNFRLLGHNQMIMQRGCFTFVKH